MKMPETQAEVAVSAELMLFGWGLVSAVVAILVLDRSLRVVATATTHEAAAARRLLEREP